MKVRDMIPLSITVLAAILMGCGGGDESGGGGGDDAESIPHGFSDQRLILDETHERPSSIAGAFDDERAVVGDEDIEDGFDDQRAVVGGHGRPTGIHVTK